MMIRIKAVKSESDEMILPVFYSDNYFFLMPGEEKVVNVRIKNKDTQGEEPKVDISGFNLI